MGDCLTREEIIAIVEETIERKGLNNKKKRKPSEYNQFIGACRTEGKDFGVCVDEWRKKKEGF